MDFKYHLETAWKLMLEHIASLLFLTIAALAASVVTLGILAPVVTAGYMHSILLLVRDRREPQVKDIFAHMNLFFPLLGFGIVVGIGAMIGFALLFLPGVLFLLVVAFLCLYMLPLMTDRKKGLIDAVKESYSMVTSEGVNDHVVVFILFAGISAVGGTVLLGSLFTQPIATIFLMSVYNGISKEKTEAGAETPGETPEEAAREAPEPPGEQAPV